MYNWELEMRRYCACSRCGEGGAGVVTGVTGEGWARLFRLSVDRFLRHHEPDALLLRVLERGGV